MEIPMSAERRERIAALKLMDDNVYIYDVKALD